MFNKDYLVTAIFNNQVVKRHVQAPNESKARLRLERAGYRIQEIRPIEDPFWKYLRQGRIILGPPATRRCLITFSNNLALLTSTAVPTDDAFKILVQSTDRATFQDVLKDVHARITNGMTIPNAMAEHPEVFDNVYVTIVRAAETAGTLPQALREIARTLKRSENVFRKLKNALIYPAIVLLLAIAAVLVFTTVAIPALADLYKSSHIQLPLLTRILIQISTVIKAHPYILLPIPFIPIYLFAKRKQILNNPTLQRFCFKIPIIKQLIIKSTCLRILQLLHQFVSANVPITTQLLLCEEAAGNVKFAEALNRIRHTIQNQGTQMSTAFEQETIFPKIIPGNIRTGELSGNLQEVLRALTDFYIEDLDDAVTKFTTILEPVLIIGLAGVVGVMVVAMYLPLFNLVKVLAPKRQ